MSSQSLIIRTCRHILPDGRHCLGAAVRDRSCCRHHLDARTRLHNMARARRRTCIPRLLVPLTPRDLAQNRAEVWRIVASGCLDFDTARMMFWALQLAETGLRSEYDQRLRTARRCPAKANRVYQVPVRPLFARTYATNPTEVLENTREQGREVHSQTHLSVGRQRTAATRRVQQRSGSFQARMAEISKPGASALGSFKKNPSPGRDDI